MYQVTKMWVVFATLFVWWAVLVHGTDDKNNSGIVNNRSESDDNSDDDRRNNDNAHTKQQESVGWTELVVENPEDSNRNAEDEETENGDGRDGNEQNLPFPSSMNSFWEHRRGQEKHKYKETEDTPVAPTEDIDIVDEEVQTEDEVEEENAEQRPNIILIITDDQDIELGSMEYMPNTLKVFRNDGVEFRHGYVTTPMCCPSRSSLLTGLYVHNHQVFTNNDNCSSVQWREKYEKKTFASYLWSSGYYTSYIGKYLNKYDGSHIPYGWDEWNTLLMNSRFYNYTVNRNGRRHRYGNNYDRDYYPDSIANDTLDFLTRMAADNNKQKKPFLLVASFPSPHGPEDSAPQYSEMFQNATPHHTPSYDFAPNSDKQWILRVTPKMTPILKEFTNVLMTKRLQTLQSVDVAVQSIFDKLKSTNMAESTYVFYTSDHGYHVGQFGLVKGKSMPYEFDIRVPFFLAGPSRFVKQGIRILEPVLNIDLAPTFLDLANIQVPYHMDGRSLVPLIKKYSQNYKDSDDFVWKDTFLIESSGRREPPVATTAFPTANMSKKNRKQARDRDEQGNTKFSFVDNETVRLNNLCVLHPHPCLPGQKKYCRKEKNRIRFRKCRQNIDFIGAFGSEHQNDPLYQIGENGEGEGLTVGSKCRCRFRRSDGLKRDFDWETERKIIDNEIEALKQKIELLRQRRREIRRKWLAENIEPSMTVHKPRKKPFSISTLNLSLPNEPNPSDPLSSNVDNFEGEEGEDYDGFADNRGKEIDNGGEDLDIDTPIFHHSDENGYDIGDITDLEDLEDEDKNGKEIPKSSFNSKDVFMVVNESRSYNTFNESFDNEDDAHLNLKFSDEDDEDMMAVGDTDDEGTDIDLNQNFKTRQRVRNRTKFRNRGKFILPNLDSDVDSTDQKCDCYRDPRWIRQREREERKRKKLLSKLRKKQRFLNRIDDPIERHQAETCGTEEKMNCFWHDSEHWRTAPFWTGGSFCFCMNSNNNTYSCLRSVNSTHNYLYCQFITGFKMYFDLRQDPYELRNLIGLLPAAQEDWMLIQLMRLKRCQGKDECWSEYEAVQQTLEPSIWEQIFGRWRRKKKRGNRRRNQN